MKPTPRQAFWAAIAESLQPSSPTFYQALISVLSLIGVLVGLIRILCGLPFEMIFNPWLALLLAICADKLTVLARRA